MEVDGCKIVNIYKLPNLQLTTTANPVFFNIAVSILETLTAGIQTGAVAYAESFKGAKVSSQSCNVTNQLGECRRHDHYRMIREKAFVRLSCGSQVAYISVDDVSR